MTSGLISGLFYGVEIAGSSGTVTNFGTIQSPGGNSGVYTALGALVTNGASGATTALIDGNFGVDIARLGGSGTLVNFGTVTGIAGDDAVRLGDLEIGLAGHAIAEVDVREVEAVALPAPAVPIDAPRSTPRRTPSRTSALSWR